MQHYSGFGLVKHGLSHHENWQRMWRNPVPKSQYDVIVVGGGGHGLATAYYLAKVHGITNVAVVEKGWLGGGNTARNTTIVRSNYLWDEAAWLYEHAMKLWEGLSQDLNYNVMFSQRGVMNLGHTLQDMRDIHRRVNANRLNGIDGEVLDVKQVQEIVPIMDCSRNTRYPVLGASWQPRAGVARHDAVAWGYARGADALGVDLLQQTEGTGFRISGGKVLGVETNRGYIGGKTIGVVTAGNSGVLAKMAGFKLPVESHPLQALVSEPMKPILDTVVMSNHVHGYVSQSDKGDPSSARASTATTATASGSYPTIEHTLQAIVELFPMFSRVRMNRRGRYRRYPPGCLPDHLGDTGGRAVLQLRLGHGRLQGDPGFGPRVCGRLPRASAGRALLDRPLHLRKTHRRARRSRRRPLRRGHRRTSLSLL